MPSTCAPASRTPAPEPSPPGVALLAPRRRRPVLTVPALVAVVVPLLAACGLVPSTRDDATSHAHPTGAARSATTSPNATTSPRVTTSPRATTAPRATLAVPPRPPAELLRTDGDGATAAASWFVALVDHAYRTGDSGPLRHLSGLECAWCSGTADDVDSLALATAGYQVPTFVPQTAEATPLDDGTWLVDVTTTTATLTRTRSHGFSVQSQGTPQPLVLGVVLRHGTGGWRVEGVDPR